MSVLLARDEEERDCPRVDLEDGTRSSKRWAPRSSLFERNRRHHATGKPSCSRTRCRTCQPQGAVS